MAANLLEQYEKSTIARLTDGKQIPDFKAGDTICVGVKIIETKGAETTTRVQLFEGLCIARKNKGLNSSFTVRKISHGEGVERSFPLYSPRIDKIEIVRRGVVRRAKLYYMRELTGKAARIEEKREFVQQDQSAEAPAKKAKASKDSK